MNSSDDLSFIDILTFISDDLQKSFRSSIGEKNKVKVLTEFLERCDDDSSIAKLRTIDVEFESDLDWFNVSRPLTLAGLRGKIVILDFFTYCCINCMHVLPELHSLEDKISVESGLVIVGVHSPKFENERDTANICSAVQRYGITHPIVNDSGSALWRSLGIRCWPTLMIISPAGSPILILMGEGNGKFLQEFISAAIYLFNQQGKIDKKSLPLQLSTHQVPASNLKFPAKIARSPQGQYAIADAGNNRVLIVARDGLVKHKIGGHNAGFVDGNLSAARFNSPQGLTFIDENTLIVADTENHALRKICLTSGVVNTLAGTGVQGSERIGGCPGLMQTMSSPWDVAVFRTRDMDMSFHLDECNVPEKTIVLISMSGTHQIWGYFPEGIIWWKFRKFEPFCCVSLIGNGLEENRNNSYPQNAAFAQPSGLAMSKDFLFIADSESSSIRKASMIDGKVMPIVGGDRNPLNLFAFGDVDGKLFNAKLQHPLGVSCNNAGNRIYVADTYNHKIKVIDVETNYISTLDIQNQEGNTLVLNEPAGLCLDYEELNLLVADTNNHVIHLVDLMTLKAQPFPLDFSNVAPASETDSPPFQHKDRVHVFKTLPLHYCKKSMIRFIIRLSSELKFTEDAPQKWVIKTVSQAFKVNEPAGIIDNGICNLEMQNIHLDFESKTSEICTIEFALNLCNAKLCIAKCFLVTISTESNVKEYIPIHDVNIEVDLSNISI
ncbi:hypothetical protein KR009_006120 [Drosophila setifemur]|nr:hypothetical protein KR009_006120 [Drosophila setifemur]